MNTFIQNNKAALIVVGIGAIIIVAAIFLTNQPVAVSETATTTPETATTTAPTAPAHPAAAEPLVPSTGGAGIVTSSIEKVWTPNGWGIAFILEKGWSTGGVAGNNGETARVSVGNNAASMMVSRDQTFAMPTGSKPNVSFRTILGTKVEVDRYGMVTYFALPYEDHKYYFRIEAENPQPFFDSIDTVQ
jgi:hypothetical protein